MLSILPFCYSYVLIATILCNFSNVIISYTQSELNAAASYVIQTLKGMEEFACCEVAVIGGLAPWKYVPSGRTTEVDI